MGNECSACSCNDQKEIDDSTALYLQSKGKQLKEKLDEKEYLFNYIIYTLIKI